MILETKEEKDAFEFICKLASELTDKRGCNDLEKEDLEKFKNLSVKSEDIIDKTTFSREVVFDSDVIQWLRNQNKVLSANDWDIIGKLIDYRRDTTAQGLISMEAFVTTFDSKQKCSEAIVEIHKRYFESWKKMSELSDRLDAIRGIKKNEMDKCKQIHSFD